MLIETLTANALCVALIHLPFPPLFLFFFSVCMITFIVCVVVRVKEKESAEEGAQSVMTTAATAQTSGHPKAWESLTEAATVKIVQYLVRCVTPFDPEATLSRSMLLLLGRSDLNDIAVERGHHGLCARLGCGRAPRGLERRRLALEREGRAAASLAAVDGGGEAEVEALYSAVAAAGGTEEEEEGHEGDGGDGEDSEREDDDQYTADSFRLAERQQQQLARLSRVSRLRQQRQHTGRGATVTGATPAAAPMVTAYEDRFCSAECLDYHESEIKPRVRAYVDLSHPELLPALANLFPQIPAASLARLAAAEAAGGGPCVRERDTTGALRPVQVGVDNEATGGPGAAAAEPQAELLSRTLQRMSMLRTVWDHEVHDRSAAPPTADSRGSPGPGSAPARQPRGVGLGSLRGPLCVLQFLYSSATPTTHTLFLQLYARHSRSLRPLLSGGLTGLPAAVLLPRMHALEARVAKGAASPTAEGAEEDDGLRVHPDQQQQRRQLFVQHVLSDDTAAVLSRLLLLDEGVVGERLWGGVWRAWQPAAHGAADLSLLYSLRFPFALPSALMSPAARSPEVLGLALVLALAAGCCCAALADDADSLSESLPEVLECVGMSEAQLTECLRVLLGC